MRGADAAAGPGRPQRRGTAARAVLAAGPAQRRGRLRGAAAAAGGRQTARGPTPPPCCTPAVRQAGRRHERGRLALQRPRWRLYLLGRPGPWAACGWRTVLSGEVGGTLLNAAAQPLLAHSHGPARCIGLSAACAAAAASVGLL